MKYPGDVLEHAAGGDRWARHAVIGVGARVLLRVKDGVACVVEHDLERGGPPTLCEEPAPDPAVALRALMARYRLGRAPGLLPFLGGAVGYLSYDAARAFERLPALQPDELGLPEACFMVTDTVIVLDTLRQTAQLVTMARVDDPADADLAHVRACARLDDVAAALAGPAPALRPLDPAAPGRGAPLASTMSRAAFAAAVRRAMEYILAGDAFQVVLSQRFSAPGADADAFDVYRALRALNPSPYMFHLALPDVCLAGASPELLVRTAGARVEVRPIAGTRPRGVTPEEDVRLARRRHVHGLLRRRRRVGLRLREALGYRALRPLLPRHARAGRVPRAVAVEAAFVSRAHTDEDIDRTLSAARDVLGTLQ